MKLKTFGAAILTIGFIGAAVLVSTNRDPRSSNNWTSISSAVAKPMLRARVANDSTVTWKDMSHGQRLDFMKRVVFPKMKEEFMAFDSTRFSAMDCGTCHGSAAHEVGFKMPNPEIWKMPKNMDGWKLVGKNNPNYMHFMMMKVKPEMAALLGMPASNPEEHKAGFGCNNCHTGD